MAKKKYFIGIDLGGTKMLIALLNKRFEVIARHKSKVEPGKGIKYLLRALEEGIEDILSDNRASLKEVSAVGIGCPGMVDHEKGTVLLAPNLPLLNHFGLAPALKKALRVPVCLENDVNAGLYGEYRFGAARKFSHVVGVFPGTGVGGALILDGRLYRGASGGAGEIGHIFMNLASPLSGRREETLENMIGRLTIASEAAVLAQRQQAPRLYRSVGTDIAKIKSGALSSSIKGGDRATEDLVVHKARILGVAMANLVNILNPELIVLGGGLIEALGGLIVKEARKVMKQMAMPPLVRKVKVAEAKLKDDAVARGVAKLAAESLL